MQYLASAGFSSEPVSTQRQRFVINGIDAYDYQAVPSAMPGMSTVMASMTWFLAPGSWTTGISEYSTGESYVVLAGGLWGWLQPC